MKATIKNVAVQVTSKNGRIVNLITLTNGTVIVRDDKQFDADLKGSFLKRKDCKDLIGGTVEGDFSFHKAGQKYVANEFNTKGVKAGTELAYESDGYRVEGFLSLGINQKADMLNRAASASAELMQELMGFTNPQAYVIEITPEIVEEPVVEPTV